MAIARPVKKLEFPSLVINPAGGPSEEMQSLMVQFVPVIHRAYNLYKDQAKEQSERFSDKDFVDAYGNEIADFMKSGLLAYKEIFSQANFSELNAVIKVMRIIDEDSSKEEGVSEGDPAMKAFSAEFESYLRNAKKFTDSGPEGGSGGGVFKAR